MICVNGGYLISIIFSSIDMMVLDIDLYVLIFLLLVWFIFDVNLDVNILKINLIY